MKPIEFKGQNVVFGEGQKEYQPLPALKFHDGQVITCWEFTEEEILHIIETRCMYICNPPYFRTGIQASFQI